MEEPDTDPEADWSIQEYPLEEKSGTLRWMLDKGFTVGKKILVTGFVLTSAPVVVPPLAVISLIGLASSVPLGIMWASYACTNKVMSKLLPLPEPSSLEYGVSSSGEDVKNGYFGGDIVEEAEEVPESVEMGIELLEKDEKNDYEEDIELMIQGLEEEAEKQPVVEINVVLDSSQDAGLEEDEEIARETTGLLEKIRDGEVNNLGGAEEGGLGMENPIEVEVLTETETEIIYDDNAGSEKPLTGIEITTDEAAGETPEAVYVETVDVVIPLEMERKPDQVGDFETIKESDEVLDAEKSSSEMSKTEEEQHKASSELEGQVSDIGVKYAQEDPDQLNKSEEEVTSTNADAKETADGRGLDAGNVALQHHSDADTVEGSASTESKQFSSPAVPESVNLINNSSNGVGTEKKKKVNTSTNSNKEYPSEEKILEKIEAMRAIVGYKAARQATCLEELKALYIFTGVEPPASIKDSTDIAEVNDKLRFLMSIVGVEQ